MWYASPPSGGCDIIDSHREHVKVINLQKQLRRSDGSDSTSPHALPRNRNNRLEERQQSTKPGQVDELFLVEKRSW